MSQSQNELDELCQLMHLVISSKYYHSISIFGSLNKQNVHILLQNNKRVERDDSCYIAYIKTRINIIDKVIINTYKDMIKTSSETAYRMFRIFNIDIYCRVSECKHWKDSSERQIVIIKPNGLESHLYEYDTSNIQ